MEPVNPAEQKRTVSDSERLSQGLRASTAVGMSHLGDPDLHHPQVTTHHLFFPWRIYHTIASHDRFMALTALGSTFPICGVEDLTFPSNLVS